MLAYAVMSDSTFNAPRAQQDSGPSVYHASCYIWGWCTSSKREHEWLSVGCIGITGSAR